MPLYPIAVTLTSASNTDTTTYTEIPLAPGQDVVSANNGLPEQVMRITGSIDTSGGTVANLRFVLRDSSTVYKFVDVTATVTTQRTTPAGGAGNYVLAITGTNDDFIDLTGHNKAAGIIWCVGIAGAFGGSAATVRLNLFPVRAI